MKPALQAASYACPSPTFKYIFQTTPWCYTMCTICSSEVVLCEPQPPSPLVGDSKGFKDGWMWRIHQVTNEQWPAVALRDTCTIPPTAVTDSKHHFLGLPWTKIISYGKQKPFLFSSPSTKTVSLPVLLNWQTMEQKHRTGGYGTSNQAVANSTGVLNAEGCFWQGLSCRLCHSQSALSRPELSL